MKEKLIALGLSEEQADKVLAVHKEVLADDYVPRHRFTEVEDQLEASQKAVELRDTQIEELKTSAGKDPKLLKQIEDLQETNRIAKEELLEVKRKSLILPKLKEKYHNADIVMGMLNQDALVYSEDLTQVTGLDEQLAKIDEEHSYLVKSTEQQAPNFVPEGFTPPAGKDTSNNNDGQDATVIFAQNLAKQENAQSEKARKLYFEE